MQLGNGLANASAEKAFANFSAMQYGNEAELSGIKSNEAIEQGNVEQEISQEKTSQLGGQQQVAESAQGIDVKSGTAAITKSQTGQIGGLDYLTIGNNAALKSLGFKMDQAADLGSAAMARLGGNFKAGQSTYQGEVQMFDDTLRGLNPVINAQAQANDTSLLGPQTGFSNNTPTPSGGIPYTGDEAQGGMPGLS